MAGLASGGGARSHSASKKCGKRIFPILTSETKGAFDACSADGAPLAKRRACATAGIGMNPASFDRECGRGQPTFRGVRRTARGRPAALVLRAAIDCAENVSHPGRQAP